MTVWLDRAGKHGEQEQLALNEGVAVVGWDEVPDMSQCKTRDELFQLLQQTYPEEKNKTLYNWRSQLWAFLHRWKKDDLVVLPLKHRSAIAIGRVVGDYKYRPQGPEGAYHSRPVEWIRTDLPRTAFDQDLLYSFGAFLTVCEIRRNNAEQRIMAILEGKKSPPPIEEPEEEIEEKPDFEQQARDQIMAYISRKFKGHNLERLVSEILKTQGYKTKQVPKGPDGGIDILAGQGDMGFDPPRLCVQVKSSDAPVDVDVLRALQGVLKKFGANQGLLVSWGGFRGAVDKEARQIYFEIRLWDSEDLITALLENYEKLSEDLQAEIPLKRIWTLVVEE